MFALAIFGHESVQAKLVESYELMQVELINKPVSIRKTFLVETASMNTEVLVYRMKLRDSEGAVMYGEVFAKKVSMYKSDAGEAIFVWDKMAERGEIRAPNGFIDEIGEE